jgi:prevent-host-death family protein
MSIGTEINASELRVQLRDVIERVRFKQERFVVQIFGKPAAVIIGIDEYTALVQSRPDSAAPLNPEPLKYPTFS